MTEALILGTIAVSVMLLCIDEHFIYATMHLLSGQMWWDCHFLGGLFLWENDIQLHHSFVVSMSTVGRYVLGKMPCNLVPIAVQWNVWVLSEQELNLHNMWICFVNRWSCRLSEARVADETEHILEQQTQGRAESLLHSHYSMAIRRTKAMDWKKFGASDVIYNTQNAEVRSHLHTIGNAAAPLPYFSGSLLPWKNVKGWSVVKVDIAEW